MSHLVKNAKELSKYMNQLGSQFRFCKIADIPSDYEFNMKELHFILFLGWKESSTMSEIAEYLGLAMSTATGVADRLVQKGFIQRKRSTEDRRLVEVELTDKGQEIHNWHLKQHDRVSQRLLEQLDKKDQDTFIKLIRKIIEKSNETNENSNS